MTLPVLIKCQVYSSFSHFYTAKGKDFSTNLIQDLKVREYFKTKLKNSPADWAGQLRVLCSAPEIQFAL